MTTGSGRRKRWKPLADALEAANPGAVSRKGLRRAGDVGSRRGCLRGKNRGDLLESRGYPTACRRTGGHPRTIEMEWPRVRPGVRHHLSRRGKASLTVKHFGGTNQAHDSALRWSASERCRSRENRRGIHHARTCSPERAVTDSAPWSTAPHCVTRLTHFRYRRLISVHSDLEPETTDSRGCRTADDTRLNGAWIVHPVMSITCRGWTSGFSPSCARDDRTDRTFVGRDSWGRLGAMWRCSRRRSLP